MTQTPPTPDPAGAGAKVTELEQRLADAAAEVAKVQGQLSEARAADPNHPDVPVPYTGHAPVVMINGKQLQSGQAVDLSAMLGGMFGGAAAGATVAGAGGAQVVNIPPVVSLNGQVMGGGQPIDLSAILGPEQAAHVRSSLEQLGLSSQFGGLFGGAGPTASGSAPPAAGSFAQPGPATAMPYTNTPGEVTGGGNKALYLLAALLVVGLLAVVVYLVATG